MTLFLCVIVIIGVVWILLFFDIEKEFLNYIIVVCIIVIVLGVNGPLEENVIYTQMSQKIITRHW